MRYWLVAGLLLATYSTGEAAACSLPHLVMPPAPPRETAEQYKVRANIEEARLNRQNALARQKLLWNKSATVLLVEITSADPLDWHTTLKPNRRVFVRPAAALKGSSDDREFVLRETGWSSCGPTPFWDLLQGMPGEQFILYLGPGASEQSTVYQSIAVSQLGEAHGLAALRRVNAHRASWLWSKPKSVRKGEAIVQPFFEPLDGAQTLMWSTSGH